MEEEEIESTSHEGEEEESIISYHTEDFISKAKFSENGTIPFNILEFDYSFGYDCHRYFNLCVADSNTLIFASGNLINFFDILENKITFRRCSTGSGIGHIIKNPTFEHIAIGENGTNPPIIIYEWPSFEIITVLHKGTTRSYSHLKYSPDGKTLVSQGGHPDYLITVWDWQRSKIALQCKSHGQDIYNIVFSYTLPTNLATCGSTHIKSWKKVETFTGIKLQGEIGKFGKTEISDIVGIYIMPDEKIVSGCEWGNILVWSEGMIKVEVCRKNNKPCHEGYITQFEYINGELISIGTDGRICFWYYDTIDQANPGDLSNILEVKPIVEYEFENDKDSNISRPIMFMQFLKQDPNNPDNNYWYAQDGNGGLWCFDFSDLQSEDCAKKLFTCHAGPIIDMYPCDWGPYVATIDQHGYLHIYNYQDRSLTLTHRFNEVTCSLVWLPCSVESTGSTIMCGFESGVIRMVSVKLPTDKIEINDNVKLLYVSKPHTMKVTRLSINPKNSILVTASEDCTAFVYQIIQDTESYPNLVPIGFLELPSAVTFITWKPNFATTIFFGCFHGDCLEVVLPEQPQTYTTISYKLTECKPLTFKFESVKSNILRENFQSQLETMKQHRMNEKREELRQMRENNPGLEIDDEEFLEAAMDANPPLPEMYIPEVPNAVLFALYTSRNSILLSMAGFDAGYVYEYSNPIVNKKTVHLSSYLVTDSDDSEIRSFIMYNNRKYIIFGMEHGEIRVCRINPNNEADFSDYWILPMHDNFNGCIPNMCLSYDQKILLTSGTDGNLFSFFINDDSPPEIQIPERKPTIELPTTDVLDIDDLDYQSLEQVVVQNERNRVVANAKKDKSETLNMLHKLTEEYNSILKRNNNLPLTQRLTEEELELDARITEDLNLTLKKEKDLVYNKLAFDVEKSKLQLKKLMDRFIEPITGLPFAIIKILKPDTMVHSIRELKLTGDFAVNRQQTSQEEDDQFLDKKKEETDSQQPHTRRSSRTLEPDSDSQDDNDEGMNRIHDVESFLRGLSPRTIQHHLGEEVNQMLKKYRRLKLKLQEQEEEWKILESEKPHRNKISSEDQRVIEDVENTIGDYKLKASANYIDTSENRPTVVSKYQQIIDCRRKIHFRREDFNNKLRDLRTKKLALISEVKELNQKLKDIRTELPQKLWKDLAIVPVSDNDIEFPEKNLELTTYISMDNRMKESKKKKHTGFFAVAVEEFDEEYEVLHLDETFFRGTRNLTVNKDEERKNVRLLIPPEVIAAIEAVERTESKLVRQMKRSRAARKVHEQDQILDYIQRSYEAFDEQLDELEKERVYVVHESVYMELFLLTLHQELMVLRRFEDMENKLSEKVNIEMKNKSIVINTMKKVTAKIEDKKSRIASIQDKINENLVRYISSIRDNKHYSFLKKIAKKKYRPPKKAGASDSSSSSDSSESSSEEEEARSSVDSDKVEMIHVDENVCPPGCSVEIYEEAFVVRDKRYDMEFRIRDEQKLVEIWQKEMDAHRKKLKAIETQLIHNQENLEILLGQKQSQLNNIDVTVLVKMHQVNIFTEENKPEVMENCLFFDKNRLSRLYSRVGELKKETAEEIEKYKNDKIHLRKIKLSCESMNKEVKILKDRIKKEMKQKFGQKISLVNLYESVLRRLIYDIKANTTSLIKFYDDKIKSVKDEYMQQLKVLQDLIRDNTEKLSFVTVLEEELLKLRKTLNLKLMSEEEITKLESQYTSELCKLKKMLKEQEKQKEWIKKNINVLNSKSKNLLEFNKSEAQDGAALTLFDGREKDSLMYETEEDYSVKDLYMKTDESKESLMVDSVKHKKMIAIHHMLSQVTVEDEADTNEAIDEMLTELTGQLKQSGYYKDKIEKTISEISEVTEGEECSEEKLEFSETEESLQEQEFLKKKQGYPQKEQEYLEKVHDFCQEQELTQSQKFSQKEHEFYQEEQEFCPGQEFCQKQEFCQEEQELLQGQKLSQTLSKDTVQSDVGIDYRYSAEPQEALLEQEIKPEVRSMLFDLFSTIGIQNNLEQIIQTLIYNLKLTEDVNYVLKYVLQKISFDMDDEKKLSVCKQIKQTLVDIMELIEVNRIKSIQQEDEF